jgi:hypothetical protein
LFPCCGAKLLDVENVLFPSACEFIPDPIISRYDSGPNFPVQDTLDAVLPCFVETDSVDVLQDVYSRGRLADLETGVVHKIGRA